MKRRFRFFLLWLGGVLLLSSGCSSLSLGYNNLNWLIRWELDSYFDLTSEQEAWLKTQLAAHIEWHRREELPQYVAFLREIQQRAGDGLTAEEWRGGIVRFEQGRARLMDRLRPDAAAFLAGLTPQQLEHLREKMEEENQELAERLQEPREKRREERREETLENLEEWFGKLSPEQQTAFGEIYDRTASQEDPTENRLERRQRTQQEFLALLEQNPAPEQASEWLWAWQRGWSQASGSSDWRTRYEERMLAMDALLTPSQREHAARKLEGYALDLEKLIPPDLKRAEFQ
ncbi:MAG: DUF6279 family lipoprotein [bacterium]